MIFLGELLMMGLIFNDLAVTNINENDKIVLSVPLTSMLPKCGVMTELSFVR